MNKWLLFLLPIVQHIILPIYSILSYFSSLTTLYMFSRLNFYDVYVIHFWQFYLTPWRWTLLFKLEFQSNFQLLQKYDWCNSFENNHETVQISEILKLELIDFNESGWQSFKCILRAVQTWARQFTKCFGVRKSVKNSLFWKSIWFKAGK